MHQHGSSNQSQPHRPQTGLSLPIRLVLYISIGILAYFLITEHLVHGSIGVSGRSNMINGSMLLMMGVSDIKELRG
jgi:hypothetical protein